MDNKVKINLNNTEKIKKFINVARSFVSDIDVVTNRATVDGKSILGLFALDLSGDTCAKIISDNAEEIKKFNDVMEEFVV